MPVAIKARTQWAGRTPARGQTCGWVPIPADIERFQRRRDLSLNTSPCRQEQKKSEQFGLSKTILYDFKVIIVKAKENPQSRYQLSRS
jgi:hypothetical protein